MLPLTQTVTVPNRPRVMLRGEHSRICTVVIASLLGEHHRRHAARHFEPGAGMRYGYKPRRASYKRWKTGEAARKRAAAGQELALVDQDLVLSGKSRRKILATAVQPQITNQFGLKFQGEYGVSFAWRQGIREPPSAARLRFVKPGTKAFRQLRGGGGPPVKPDVTPEDMRKEMGRWADDETVWIAGEFAARYWGHAQRVRGTRTIGKP